MIKKENVTRYSVEYCSHFTVKEDDAVMEISPWSNGEGYDLTINDGLGTRFLSLGEADAEKLSHLLSYVLTDKT